MGRDRSASVAEVEPLAVLQPSGLSAQRRRSGGSKSLMSFRKRTKTDVCEKFLLNLRESAEAAADEPGFVESVKRHFELLPTRYALDVNTRGLEVLNHKRLLEEARANSDSVAFQVRKVEVILPRSREDPLGDVSDASLDVASPIGSFTRALRFSPKMRPAFASSPNLQALMVDSMDQEISGDEGLEVSTDTERLLFYEITVAAKDRPKFLSRVSQVLGEAALNIREAHVFNTYDKFSLDVFVVDGWQGADQDELEEVLRQHFRELLQGSADSRVGSALASLPAGPPPAPRPAGADDWEIDTSQLQVVAKIAAGTFGNLYRGSYYGQDVAVKIIKDMEESFAHYDEFMREVTIMRKVRHRNVVQFIGACTTKPNLCILFEYMTWGSVLDYLRKEGALGVSETLRIGMEVCRGMDYLHKMNIIHRDLKTANLLMDENKVVKIADFGVARVVEQSGHMTAETGTYRWMAPEVIEHKPYDTKADVFSFGVLLWELLTGQIPYNDHTPLQAAVGVVQKGLRPTIPPGCPMQLAAILTSCWSRDPAERPSFAELLRRLQELREHRLDLEAQHESRSSRKLLQRFRTR